MIFFRSRRHITASTRVFKAAASLAKPDSAAAIAGDIKSTKARRISKKEQVLEGTEKWTRDDGAKYNNLAPRHWLHQDRPFPKNPWFCPPAPVGDAVREEVYQTYVSSPHEWTPRKLAAKFHISVIRVEAILRLKHLERTQSLNGYVLQTRFAKEMERLMAVGTGPMIKEGVTSVNYQSTVTPVFMLEDTDENSLNKPSEKKGKAPLDLGFQRRSDGNYLMALSGVLEEPEMPAQVLQRNAREASRHDLVIADVSSEDVYVRQKDGTLRTATRSERVMHFKLYPKELPMEIQKQKVKPLWEL